MGEPSRQVRRRSFLVSTRLFIAAAFVAVIILANTVLEEMIIHLRLGVIGSVAACLFLCGLTFQTLRSDEFNSRVVASSMKPSVLNARKAVSNGAEV